ncbi:MAG: hypothetical protein M3237_10260 [Actinomycetota bacterium]|nr:hypothetical protein [Actinomycetota bacterium]
MWTSWTGRRLLNRSGPTRIVLAEFTSPVYDDSGISLVTSSVRRQRPDSLDPVSDAAQRGPHRHRGTPVV